MRIGSASSSCPVTSILSSLRFLLPHQRRHLAFLSDGVITKLPINTSTNHKHKMTTMINFAKGHPNRQLLPVQEIQEILAYVSLTSNQDALTDSLNYPKRDTGTPRLLLELKAFLDRHTHDDDDSNRGGEYHRATSTTDEALESPHLFMTHGVSHGLDMLCVAQAKPGDVVLVERPTYFLAAGIFRTHGLEVQSLPMIPQVGGIDLDRLECDLETGTIPPPRMIYVIPTHHNPKGSTMSIDDRWRLALLARRYGILVVADEVYHLLDWREVARDGPRPARMAILDCLLRHDDPQGGEGVPTSLGDRVGCCVSVSSFTKIFAPGVRCGWVEGPPHIIKSLENLGYIQSQGGCIPLVGELMYASLKSGIGDRVLATLNGAYQERSQMLCEILTSGEGIRLHRLPIGGYFVWVSFDGIADTTDFLEFCLERGIRFLPGVRCDVTTPCGALELGESNSCRRYARFCFADLDLDDIKEGAHRVVECYRDYARRIHQA
jgi:2-aminoadipate transaminase